MTGGHSVSPAPCQRREQIAIDGPAASGKSTLARNVAAALGGYYVNTGDMYRALTWVMLARDIDPEADPDGAAALLPQLDLAHRKAGPGTLVLTLDGVPVPMAEIRAPHVAAKVSFTARIPAVRTWLLGRQRAAAELGLIVMEGRDIGTVIFPRARHKFFLTASVEERARRRLAQAGETAEGATLASVAADIAARDRMDSARAVAPLRPAADAVYLDNSALDAEATLQQVLRRIREHWAGSADTGSVG